MLSSAIMPRGREFSMDKRWDVIWLSTVKGWSARRIKKYLRVSTTTTRRFRQYMRKYGEPRGCAAGRRGHMQPAALPLEGEVVEHPMSAFGRAGWWVALEPLPRQSMRRHRDCVADRTCGQCLAGATASTADCIESRHGRLSTFPITILAPGHILLFGHSDDVDSAGMVRGREAA